MLTEIRWHGRAGQGVITVGRLLASAAIMEGKHAQAFPEFGPERLGSAMSGYTRIADEPIEIHSPIYTPDIVVVIDPTLIKMVDVTKGLKEGGNLVVNTSKPIPENFFEALKRKRITAYGVNATKISLSVLGSAKAMNTATLGALLKASPLVSLDSVFKALGEHFKGPIFEKNVEMIRRGYEEAEAK